MTEMHGKTPLDIAVKSECMATIVTLLNLGADPNRCETFDKAEPVLDVRSYVRKVLLLPFLHQARGSNENTLHLCIEELPGGLHLRRGFSVQITRTMFFFCFSNFTGNAISLKNVHKKASHRCFQKTSFDEWSLLTPSTHFDGNS